MKPKTDICSGCKRELPIHVFCMDKPYCCYACCFPVAKGQRCGCVDQKQDATREEPTAVDLRLEFIQGIAETLPLAIVRFAKKLYEL